MGQRGRKTGMAILMAVMVLVIALAAARRFQWTILPDNLAGNLLSPSAANSSRGETAATKDGSAGKTGNSSTGVGYQTSLTVWGLHFDVLAAEISKQSGGLPRPDFGISEEVSFDSQDTLTSAHSYVRVRLTITNKRDEETVVSLNNTKLYIYADGDTVGSKYVTEYCELIGMDVKTTGPITQTFHYTMQPEQKQTFTFAYIIEDSYLEQKAELVLCMAPGGDSPQTPREYVDFVRLEPLLKKEDMS